MPSVFDASYDARRSGGPMAEVELANQEQQADSHVAPLMADIITWWRKQQLLDAEFQSQIENGASDQALAGFVREDERRSDATGVAA